ncbi:MAG: inorganic pyrophosphatase [Clostridia bacterium]|nr:inorganic pyrophosphatase [Clostridia bacterium]
MGSFHPEHKDLFYPVNYGYIEGLFAGDGEEQDAYVLGIDEPVAEFSGKVTAVVHRTDDVEDKWIVVPDGVTFTVDEIEKTVRFQEKYFSYTIELL